MAKLSQLAEAVAKDEKGFEIDLSHFVQQLPSYVPLDQVEVDLNELFRICRLTRVDVLLVMGFEEKGEDSYDVKGIGSDGAGVGTASTGKPRNKMVIADPRAAAKELDLPTVGRSY